MTGGKSVQDIFLGQLLRSHASAIWLLSRLREACDWLARDSGRAGRQAGWLAAMGADPGWQAGRQAGPHLQEAEPGENTAPVFGLDLSHLCYVLTALQTRPTGV